MNTNAVLVVAAFWGTAAVLVAATAAVVGLVWPRLTGRWP